MKNAERKPRSIVEVEYLRKKYSEEKDVKTRERILGVLLYFNGYDPPEIAIIIGKTTKTIRTWIRLYEKERHTKVLKDKPRQ